MARCMCKGCMNEGINPVSIAKRGNRNGYVCDFHLYNMESYSDENEYRHGSRKVNGFTFSVELETSYSDIKARGELLDFGFLPTSDCTVDVEYKSPIYEGMNAISKQCVSIERMLNERHMRIGNDCGTHFHVGHVDSINPTTMGYLKRFYHSLFLPLCEVMKANPTETIVFWGRNFTHYANTINENSNANEHCNFINLQHNYTVEFRLAKFQDAEQYMNVVRFCKEVVNTVINNFIEHFNDEGIDSTRYSNITEYRKHKAAVTAKKIVKLYKKYADIAD